MPDVRMPDGTIIKNVPANASREQIVATHERAKAAGKVPDSRPTSYWQGVVEGTHKVANNMLRFDPVGRAGDWIGEQMGFKPVTQSQIADLTDKKFQNSRAKSQYQGSTMGNLTGNILTTLPAALATKNPWVSGAATGAMMTDKRDAGGILMDAGVGALGGKAGDIVGKRLLAPAAAALMRTKGGQAVSSGVSGALSKLPAALRPKSALLSAPRKLTPLEKALPTKPTDMQVITGKLEEAKRLGLPYSIADATSKTRALGGSVSRKSADAREIAENMMGPRAAGQADRAIQAIDMQLAPITNIEQRSAAIKKAAWDKSQPLYDKALAQDAPIDDELQAILKTPAGQQALERARTIMANEGKSADEIATFIRDVGDSPTVPQDGRYTRGVVGNPADYLSRGNVSGRNGPVPKVGPLDLVGWVRTNGGLKDQGTELTHMGLTNAPRRGMDFVGREAQFGPLVNPNGMNLDDAALNAWEAGYFPHLSERPDTNQFLDALRGTHEGWDRHFLPDDLPEVYNYGAALEQKHLAQKARSSGSLVGIDKSEPAGFDIPTAPLSAYPVETVKTPKFETLNYIKRGLDSVLSDKRNPITGKLDLEGDPVAKSVNDVLQRFKGRLDDLNPDYAAARATYSDAIRPREALQLGGDMARTNIPQRQFDAALSRMDAGTMPDFQRGLATSMADTVEKTRLSGNPYNAVYGSPLQQNKVAKVFPEGSKDFAKQYELEKDMAKAAYEAIGGSPTQARAMADQMFDQGNMPDLQDVLNPKLGIVKAGGRMLADQYRVGSEKKAAAMAPMLFNKNPDIALEFLKGMAARRAAQEAQRQAYGRLLGGVAVPGAITVNNGGF